MTFDGQRDCGKTAQLGTADARFGSAVGYDGHASQAAGRICQELESFFGNGGIQDPVRWPAGDEKAVGWPGSFHHRRSVSPCSADQHSV